MSEVWLHLGVALLMILLAAEIFTNALEHFGSRVGISEGVTGSLLAAVGTALPETMVPLLAILRGPSGSGNTDIGVGAILGAPLMLSTLALGLMGLSVVRKRGWQGELSPERTGMSRDLNFFIVAYGLACAAMFVPHQREIIRLLLSMGLVSVYVLYIAATLRASQKLVSEGHATSTHRPLLLTRLGLPNRAWTISLQLILGLALLIVGAEYFIEGVHTVSAKMRISALLLSLLIIPIATELPEKINSILWIRSNRDTLAFGNITGAMVFQGSLLPALGVLMTPWEPQKPLFFGVVVTLLAALWLRWLWYLNRPLKVWHLSVNGGLYLIYLYLMLS